MARILSTRQDVHLLLMGFPNETLYQQQARQLGIESHVTFTGRIPYAQAPRYLALGDVAVAPKLSLTEGAGKLLNYMAVGLPTVAFDTPVARQYLGDEGYFAAKGDIAGLAVQLLAALFPADEIVQARGLQLRQRAITVFGWQAAGEQIGAIYQELRGEARQLAAPRPDLVVSHD
jgi:glycosyltransferase involved in cell wall biosynthesis